MDSRARAYLDANCANCHRPGTVALGNMDLRVDAALSGMGICEVDPEEGNVGVWGAQILKPGQPESSTLWLRMNTVDPDWRMPAIATELVHAEAITVLYDWIASLSSCETP